MDETHWSLDLTSFAAGPRTREEAGWEPLHFHCCHRCHCCPCGDWCDEMCDGTKKKTTVAGAEVAAAAAGGEGAAVVGQHCAAVEAVAAAAAVVLDGVARAADY